MATRERDQLLVGIQEVFREQFLDGSLSIDETTTPQDIEEWDSLAQINLLVAIEQRFSINFTAEEMGEAGTVSAIMRLVESKKGATAES